MSRSDRPPTRWLVTGAAGFIGSHLVEHLLRRGDAVVGLDNFATGSRANLDDALTHLPPDASVRFEFIEGDIREPEACRRATDGVDRVLHQAALGSVPRSIDDPLSTNEVNVGGFVNVLDAARRAGVRRLVYASSSAVYGDSPDNPRREGSEGHPISPYAASKRANEDYAAAFARAYGMAVVGLRYFNVYGPRQNPEGPYAAVIPRWIGRLLAGERCVIYGDGSTSRDFTYVGDVVAANLAVADSSLTDGVYNVAFGAGATLSELYAALRKQVADATGDEAIHALEPIFEPFRLGDVRQSLADTTLARESFNFVPRHDLGTGLRQMVDWFATRATWADRRHPKGATGN